MNQELLAALQPFVDAATRDPLLAAHLPRLNAALAGLSKPTPITADGPHARRSARTIAALNEIAGGMSMARAARLHGVAASTLSRALAEASGSSAPR